MTTDVRAREPVKPLVVCGDGADPNRQAADRPGGAGGRAPSARVGLGRPGPGGAGLRGQGARLHRRAARRRCLVGNDGAPRRARGARGRARRRGHRPSLHLGLDSERRRTTSAARPCSATSTWRRSTSTPRILKRCDRAHRRRRAGASLRPAGADRGGPRPSRGGTGSGCWRTAPARSAPGRRRAHRPARRPRLPELPPAQVGHDGRGRHGHHRRRRAGRAGRARCATTAPRPRRRRTAPATRSCSPTTTGSASTSGSPTSRAPSARAQMDRLAEVLAGDGAPSPPATPRRSPASTGS